MGKVYDTVNLLLGDKVAGSLLDLKNELSISYKKNIKKIIKNNIKFKDIHLGERCYILGNGPSLLDVDLKKFENEFVFSVNYFNMVPNYENAKTNVHLWMDLNSFDLRPEVKENPELLKKNYYDMANQNPICFVPIEAQNYILDHKLDEILNFNYLFINKPIDKHSVSKIDLTKGIYSCSTVVQYALQIAIYMGFTEIVLLGCDSTNILAQLNTIIGSQETNLHAYSEEFDGAEEATKELLSSWNTHDFLYDQYVLFKGYEVIASFCDSKGIKIVNCSNPTLLTEIPRYNLMNIMS